jgi:tetratricopeptide (TPR) repeat protein
MSRYFSYLLLISLFAALSVGCSRDPNVRKRKYFESGQRYFAKGKYQEAIIQFKNAIQVDSAYADAHYQLAQVYLKLQGWRQAYDEFNRTVELQPDNCPARLGVANFLIASGDLKNARENTEFLLRKQPDNPEVIYAVVDLLSAEEKYADAITQAQKAISLAPDRWESYLKLASLQMRTDESDQAEPNFKKAVELNPKAVVPRLALASYYQIRGRLPEAERQIQSAMDAEPKDPEPPAAMVRVYMVQGQSAEAEQLLKDVRRQFADNAAGYRLLGDFYYANRDYANALTEYAAICREHPEDVRAKKNYIQLLIIKNDVTKAAKLNNEVLKDSPGDVEGLIYRAQIELHEARAKEALETLQNALRNDPESGLAYYYLGMSFQEMGDWTQADNAWQNATRLSPDLLDAHLSLARSALREGDMRALEQSASQIIRLQPKAPAGYAMRALASLKRGQPASAEQDAMQAISLAPQAPDGYMQMGNVRLAQKRYAEAANFYRQTLDRDPSSADALSSLMNIYLTQGQLEMALSVAEEQISKVPDSSAFYDLLGTARFEHRKTAEDMMAAEADLRKSTALNKNNADAWLKLSQVQAAIGKIEEAVATSELALQDNPQQTEYYVLIGRLDESKGKWAEAMQSYRKALDVDPRNPQASNNLAFALAQTGTNLDAALSLAQIARRGMPNSDNAADTLGWVFYQKGAYGSAIDSFREALNLTERNRAPDNPNVLFHLGLAYQKNGQPVLARQQLEKVLKIAPNYSRADDVRKVLAQLGS